MNHFYRIIWSQVKNSYVVVSEIAGSHAKSPSGRRHGFSKSAILAAFLLLSSTAGAANVVVDQSSESSPAGNTVASGTDVVLVGTGNAVTGGADDKVIGQGNTVKDSDDVTAVGGRNTIINSDRQNVIGDDNSITQRDAGTVSGYQGIVRNGTSDLVIGKGNKISGNDTYMKGYESLTVIGNNNESVDPSSGIVIGDNQSFSTINESVVIGSMTPDEKADPTIAQKHASVVIGYHAQSGTADSGGMNVAVGYNAKAYGFQDTVTGIKSIVEAGDFGTDGYLASVYGGLNKVASNNAGQSDGMANSIVGVLNKTEGANGALVFGAGNTVAHSFGSIPIGADGVSMDQHWGMAILLGQYYAGNVDAIDYDDLRAVMGSYMATSGGSVVAMGNGNASDYAVRSQIMGSGNILKGTEQKSSINNTIGGYANTGTNIERVSMIGTGNILSDGTADVVIGDYHEMNGGKNNVILGSMATEEKTVTKHLTLKVANPNSTTGEVNDVDVAYDVIENVPLKTHAANVSNAVMIGYNADAAGNDSIAIGKNAQTVAGKGQGISAIAMGTSASASAVSAIAIGNGAQATGEQSISLGTGNIVSGAHSGAIGDPNTVSGTESYVLGNNNTVTTDKTFVLGNTVTTTAANSVFLGDSSAYVESGATTKGLDAYTGDTVAGKTISFAGGNAVSGVVSIGSSTGTRRIQNVAAGLISATSTDAVNGSQLYAVAASLANNISSSGTSDSAAVKTELIADGMNYAGDSGDTIHKDLGNTLKVTGGATGELTDNNIGVVSENGELKVKLAKEITGLTFLKVDRLDVGQNSTHITDTDVETDTLKVGNVTINKDTGINAGGQKITNVADGTENGDAVNYGQLRALQGNMGELGDRINKVGAGAAALAALHPLDFDPDDKWDFSAGFGNYRNASAAAVGVFYRPNERTMFNLGWTMGDSRNMINAGFSIKLGHGNEYMKLSKAEMAQKLEQQDKKINTMESELEALKEQVAQLVAARK